MGGGGRSSVRNGNLELTCEWNKCVETFTEIGEFYQHLQNHFVQDIFDQGKGMIKQGQHHCKWELCEFLTDSSDDLLRHLYFHGYHTKVKWWGRLCSREENLGECYATQNRNIIPDLPDGFKCEWENCGLIWDIPDPFYSHVYDHVHFSEIEDEGEEKYYKCHWKDCNYKYKVKRTMKTSMAKFKLRDHLRTHTKERLFACPSCGNLYVNKTKFIDHVNRQTESKNHNFQCTHCARTFATERLLKDHVRHHVNNYKCAHCDMTCPNPSALKHHFKYKHSDVRPHKCAYCEYRSKTIYDLRIHENFHRSSFGFGCTVQGCNYKVRTLQNLRLHMRNKHSQVGTMWICHVCNQQYTNGSHLTHHLINVHHFKWPPGHSRFKYTQRKDGHYRLQTFRFESINLHTQTNTEQQQQMNSIESAPVEQEQQEIVTSEDGRSAALTRSFVRRNLMKEHPADDGTDINDLNCLASIDEDGKVVESIIRKTKAKRSRLNFDHGHTTTNVTRSERRGHTVKHEILPPSTSHAMFTPFQPQQPCLPSTSSYHHQPEQLCQFASTSSDNMTSSAWQSDPSSLTTLSPVAGSSSTSAMTRLSPSSATVKPTILVPSTTVTTTTTSGGQQLSVVRNRTTPVIDDPSNPGKNLVRREDGNPVVVLMSGIFYYVMKTVNEDSVTYGLASIATFNEKVRAANASVA